MSDPDKHIENIEVVITYCSVSGAVKCKFFVTTLRRGAMTWFKNLRRNSVGSWCDLCHEFTTHFTVSRTQPKTVASLEAIVQGKSEPLRDYIKRFHKEADENMKRYLIIKGLHEGTDVKKSVHLNTRRLTINSSRSSRRTSGTKRKSMRTISIKSGRRNLLSNPLKSPSMTRRRKTKLRVKVKDPAVASHNTLPCQSQGKRFWPRFR